MSSEALRLADELEYLAHGRTEWRVQDPISKAYCISFDRASSLNPERDAREWLSSHVSNHPNSPKARYEVAQSLCFTYLEESARQAASLLRTQAARNAELEAEREKLLATVANDTTMVFDLCAERDQLRTEVERLRTPLTPDELADLCEAWLQKCQLATNIVDAFEAGARAIEAAKEA